jgi:hypothetical protein
VRGARSGDVEQQGDLPIPPRPVSRNGEAQADWMYGNAFVFEWVNSTRRARKVGPCSVLSARISGGMRFGRPRDSRATSTTMAASAAIEQPGGFKPGRGRPFRSGQSGNPSGGRKGVAPPFLRSERDLVLRPAARMSSRGPALPANRMLVGPRAPDATAHCRPRGLRKTTQ